jgi:hypothetical protein
VHDAEITQCTDVLFALAVQLLELLVPYALTLELQECEPQAERRARVLDRVVRL